MMVNDYRPAAKAAAALAAAMLFLAACGGNGANTNEEGAATVSPSPAASPVQTGEATASPGAEQTAPPATGGKGAIAGISASDAAVNIIFALRQEDAEQFRGYVHPEKGVLLYPSSSIDKNKAVTFKPNEVPDFSAAEKRSWGTDASGKAVQLSFAEYYKQYLYDQDYASASKIGNNELLGANKGKSNIGTLFPDATFLDYYMEKAEGGWSSLILILEQSGDTWYLTGAVHDAGK